MSETHNRAQRDLWHDTVLDALGAAVQAAGGIKRVSASLWPTLDGATAASRLRSCLNADQPHKLDPQETLAIAKLARQAGDHSLMRFLAAELGYDVKPLEPEDQAAELQRQFIAAVELANAFATRLQRITSNVISMPGARR